jgi:hypothetical protein
VPHDVRVVDRGQDLGFNQEPGAHQVVGHEARRQLLDRHLAPELAMASGYDHSKGAAAELRTYLVPR